MPARMPPPQAAPPYAPHNVHPAYCQLGHEIAAGLSYCAFGHPIALQQMQFVPPPAYGAPVPAPVAPQPYAAPPPMAVPAPAAMPVAQADGMAPKILRGFLVTYGRNPNGDYWPLNSGRHTIGRLGSAEGIDIQIQDPTVSSRHATLVVDANGPIVVEDNGSTNGTFVNDMPLGHAGRSDLRDGDRLRVGGFTTIIKVIDRF
jgi:hypothetical protein